MKHPIRLVDPIYLYRNRNLIRPAVSWRWRKFNDDFCRMLRCSPLALRIFATGPGYVFAPNHIRLRLLKDRHRGKRCFIIGNGPSLRMSDLDQLLNEVTFASNKIYLAFEKTDWRPIYYTVCDVLVARNNKEAISELSLPKVFGSLVRPFLGRDRATCYVPHLENFRDSDGMHFGFGPSLVAGAYGGYSVIYLQLQMAYYMGIREIYLIGVDFSFKLSDETHKKTELGETILVSVGEQNHFDPRYRKPGETWTLPRLDYQRAAFNEAKRAFDSVGGRILNASRRTALDVFPVVDFNSLFPG